MKWLLLLALPISLHARWTQTNGPEGGPVKCLAVRGDTVYAGSPGGGVHYSTNSGATWTEANDGLTNWNVTALASIDGGLVAGTDHGGVFRLANGESRWSTTSSKLSQSVVTALAASGTTVFAGTGDNGVFRSTDGGVTWWTAVNGIGAEPVYALAQRGANVFAGTLSGLFLWSNITTGWQRLGVGVAVHALAVHNDTLIAATAQGTYLLASAGNGYSATDSGLYAAITCLAGDGGAVYAGTSYAGIFATRNGDGTWLPVAAGPRGGVNALVVNGGHVFAATDSGVFVSAGSGAPWTRSNTGMSNSVVGALTCQGTNVLAGGTGIARSTDGGASWTRDSNGIGEAAIRSFTMNGTTLHAAGTGAFRSTDNGIHWIAADSGIVDTYGTAADILSIAASDGNVFAMTLNDGVVLVSTDNGSRWNWETRVCWLTGVYVYAFLSSGRTLFAGTDFDAIIFRSSDSGMTWTSAPTAGYSGSVAFALAGDERNLFAATTEGVFRSIDTGATWSAVTARGLPSVTTLAKFGEQLFAGTPDGGVYLSEDNGANWTFAGDGLPEKLNVNAFAVGGDDLYIATAGAGVWRRPLAEMMTPIREESKSQYPEQPALIGIDPNPFSDVATIEYTLPADARSSLKIYNALGAEVLTLARGGEAAGRHRVVLRAAGLQSGMYWCRLTTESGASSRSFVIVH